jgi:hypothetical protein
MGRFTLIVAAGIAGLIAPRAHSARSQEPRPSAPPPAEKQADPGQRPAQEPAGQFPGAAVPQGIEFITELLGRGAPKLEPAELAGIAAGSTPAVLTLEQAYSLALLRVHNPAGLAAVRRANLFDPVALDEHARRAGVLEFDLFRGDFLSSGFRDPAPGFLTALKHRLAIDSARDQVTLTENLRRLFDLLIHGEASGVSQLQVDQIDYSLLLARQDLDFEMNSYASAVDELKVSLGLPASAPLVLDERILQPFIKAFTSIATWQRNPRRQLGMLGALHNRLPRLDELKIAGRSLPQVALGTIPEADFLQACVEAAAKRRAILKDAQTEQVQRDALELRIRKLARSLLLTRRNHDVHRKSLELAVREVDQRFEQLINPPAGGTAALAQAVNAAVHTLGVLQAQTRLYRGRTEVVAHWLQFKEQSLRLYRELGIMPYESWEAFHRSFLPDHDQDHAPP